MIRRPVFVVISVIGLHILAAHAPAQDSKVQALEGDYFGLTQLGIVNPSPTNIRLAIERQESRRFEGTLSYIEQDNLSVAGTISDSGECRVVVNHEEQYATLGLDWRNYGGGAAALTGDLALTTDKEKQSGPVVFLRPFDDPAIDWSAQVGQFPARFTSDAGGDPIDATFDLTDGAHGLLQATIPGWVDPEPQPVVPNPPGWTDPEPQPVVIATTNADGAFVAVGVGSGFSQVVTLTGRWHFDPICPPIDAAIQGTYLIETTSGKQVDAGRFEVLLVRRAR
jgi:hypothetical protein